MRAYKYQPGTSPQIYDVLTIGDNGRMTLYFHGTDRVLEYTEVRTEGTPYGTRIVYGSGSSMPWTDTKGDRVEKWQEVSLSEVDIEPRR